MNKTTKVQSKKATAADSKPTQLAKIIFRGIERYIKAIQSQNRDKNYSKTLDFSSKRRVNRDS
jgi:hypothetical protein